MSTENQRAGQQFTFTDEQRVNWLRLYRSQNVGPKTFRDLIMHYGSASAALEALPEMAKRGGAASRIRICSLEAAQKEMFLATQTGARFVTMGEAEFPNLLRQTDHCPPVLCCKGNHAIFQKPSVAIVGSRNASIVGLKLTERLAGELGEKNYVVVSGLARGIDTAAHAASLKTGTIAVFGTGIDVVFPKENKRLASDIVENGGLILSEMPFGHQPTAKDFPRRNRIVTGLANGVLVIEAAKRSGSLITARIANETGRIVMAIPGSPLDPRSSGTNGLIREGATLVTGIEDILEALSPLSSERNEFVYDISERDENAFGDDDEDLPAFLEPTADTRARIIAAIGPTPLHVDDIIRYCDAAPGEVQLVILELALAGRIERHSGNMVSLILSA